MIKLDAVNGCLKAVGLSPVTSLTSGPDATKAATHVDLVSEKVQESGWSCNTDYEVTLVPDLNGKVWVPANALMVSAKKYNSGIRRVTTRKTAAGLTYLWNTDDLTDVFTDSVKIDIIYLFDFDDLTPTLQRYVAERSAREYQETDLGSGAIDKFTSRKEQDALTALLSAEAEEEDWNTLLDNEHCALITGRNNTFFGR